MVKDHLGNEYESIVEMCKAYSINPSTYKFRISSGMTVKNALLMPLRKNILHCFRWMKTVRTRTARYICIVIPKMQPVSRSLRTLSLMKSTRSLLMPLTSFWIPWSMTN